MSSCFLHLASTIPVRGPARLLLEDGTAADAGLIERIPTSAWVTLTIAMVAAIAVTLALSAAWRWWQSRRWARNPLDHAAAALCREMGFRRRERRVLSELATSYTQMTGMPAHPVALLLAPSALAVSVRAWKEHAGTVKAAGTDRQASVERIVARVTNSI